MYVLRHPALKAVLHDSQALGELPSLYRFSAELAINFASLHILQYKTISDCFYYTRKLNTRSVLMFWPQGRSMREAHAPQSPRWEGTGGTAVGVPANNFYFLFKLF